MRDLYCIICFKFCFDGSERHLLVELSYVAEEGRRLWFDLLLLTRFLELYGCLL
jgi:hypothetical protein